MRGSLTEQGEHLGGGGDPPGALGHGRQLLGPGGEEPRADEELQTLHQLLEALRREPEEEEKAGTIHITYTSTDGYIKTQFTLFTHP